MVIYLVFFCHYTSATTEFMSTTADGTTRGTCPMSPSDLLCHSDGYCNVCRLIDDIHVGCDEFSATPVCDADSTTIGVQDSAVDKRAVCSGCKKDGTFRDTQPII